MSAAWRWLWRGDLPVDAIAVDYRPELPTPSERVRSAAAEHFRALRRRQPQLRLTDDPVAPLLDFRAGEDALHLSLGRSGYAHWLFARARQEELEERHGAAGPCRPLALCAALIVDSGALLMQRRSRQVAEGAGQLHVPGGHLDPTQHLSAGLPHPTVAMLAELDEELGLGEEDLRDGRLVGLIEDARTGKPELLYRWRLALGEEELRRRAAAAVDSFETESLHFAPPDTWAALARESRLGVPSYAQLELLGA